MSLVVKNPPANAGDIKDLGLIPGSGRYPGGGHGNRLQYPFFFFFDSSILAWRIPWTQESGELLSKGLQRVRHDWSDLACKHVLTFTDSLFRNFPTDMVTDMHLGSCCKNMWGLLLGVPKIPWEPSELSAWLAGSELKPCLEADGFALWLWRGRAPADKWDHSLFCFSAVSSLKLMNPQRVSSISKEKGSLISFVGLRR